LYADLERGKYPVWESLDTPDFYPGSGIIFATVTVSPRIMDTAFRITSLYQKGDYSKRIEALPDEQVKAEVMAVLRSMFPHLKIPQPLDFYFPRWLNNPLYRGSFSIWPASFVPEHQDNIRAPIRGRLWFAGEHTSRKWFGPPPYRRFYFWKSDVNFFDRIFTWRLFRGSRCRK
jgi:polyamine oxidase